MFSSAVGSGQVSLRHWALLFVFVLDALWHVEINSAGHLQKPGQVSEAVHGGASRGLFCSGTEALGVAPLAPPALG